MANRRPRMGGSRRRNPNIQRQRRRRALRTRRGGFSGGIPDMKRPELRHANIITEGGQTGSPDKVKHYACPGHTIDENCVELTEMQKQQLANGGLKESGGNGRMWRGRPAGGNTRRTKTGNSY